MAKEKRLKTKVLQVRLKPEDFEFYAEYAKKHNLSKTQLFMNMLGQLRENGIRLD